MIKPRTQISSQMKRQINWRMLTTIQRTTMRPICKLQTSLHWLVQATFALAQTRYLQHRPRNEKLASKRKVLWRSAKPSTTWSWSRPNCEKSRKLQQLLKLKKSVNDKSSCSRFKMRKRESFKSCLPKRDELWKKRKLRRKEKWSKNVKREWLIKYQLRMTRMVAKMKNHKILMFLSP